MFSILRVGTECYKLVCSWFRNPTEMPVESTTDAHHHASSSNGAVGSPSHSDYERSNLRSFILRSVTFEVPHHYVDEIYGGGGAYGNVCFVTDTRTNCRLAVKKMYRPFYDAMQAKRAFRELRLLRILEHENVIALVNVYTPEDCVETMENLYIVTAYAGRALSDCIDNTILTAEHCQLITYQILSGLKYIHSGGVIHRDLKPHNLALTPDCELKVKILDFGLARKVCTDIMTEYVVTRSYRAPEVIFWNGLYDERADLWSVGCILAELLSGHVLFKGDNSLDQYEKIVKVCGEPDAALLDKIEARSSRETRETITRYSRNYSRVDLGEHLRQLCRDPSILCPPNDASCQTVVDFLDRILVIDPDNRMSVIQALQHPYLKLYHNESEEPTLEENIELDEAINELQGAPVDINNVTTWKRQIWEEIALIQSQLTPSWTPASSSSRLTANGSYSTDISRSRSTNPSDDLLSVDDDFHVPNGAAGDGI